MIIQLIIDGIEYECIPKYEVERITRQRCEPIEKVLIEFERMIAMTYNEREEIPKLFYNMLRKDRTYNITSTSYNLSIDKADAKTLMMYALQCKLLVKKYTCNVWKLGFDRKLLETTIRERNKS